MNSEFEETTAWSLVGSSVSGEVGWRVGVQTAAGNIAKARRTVKRADGTSPLSRNLAFILPSGYIAINSAH